MNLIGNVRIGRDAEIKHTGSGTAVCNIIGVYNYGRKGDDGNKPSQWVELSLFGKQAEALTPYLTKGAVVCVTAEDVHIETYTGKNGVQAKLVGRTIAISFAPSQPARDAAPKPKPAAPADLDDNDLIPF